MLKTTLSALALTTTFNLGFAEQTAYSQNNLSQQNKQAHFLRKCPILFNADLLYGKINSQPTATALINSADSNGSTSITPPIKNRAQLGFRAGLGVGFKNRFNLSGQYTYLRNKETNQDSYVTPLGLTSSYLGIPILTMTIPNSISFNTKQVLKWQQGDLLLQTAAWMLSSYLRLQPYGGIRYTQINANLNQTAAFLFEPAPGLIFPVNINLISELKTRSVGPIIGADLKYLITQQLHFFSNATIGLLAGYILRNLALTEAPPFPFAISSTLSAREDLNWLPTLDFSFGLAQERKIGNRFLLSLRVAYEMHMINNSSYPVFTSLGTNPTLISGFYYLVQVGSFGVTLAF